MSGFLFSMAVGLTLAGVVTTAFMWFDGLLERSPKMVRRSGYDRRIPVASRRAKDNGGRREIR